MPSASVIIPLYNKGMFVARAIDSVLAQTCEDFEIIVIDDGSTDNGPDIVRQYKDPRIRLIRQSNAGPGAARNAGVRAASSKYVAYLDADDEWLPDFLQTSLSNLANNPDCVLCSVNHYRGDEKLLATTMSLFDIGFTAGRPWRLSPEIEPEKMWPFLFYLQSGGTVMCRRDIVLKYGGSYEHRCTWAEDQYLWLQVMLNHRIYYDMTPLWQYHTEESELNEHNRKLPEPLFPFLTDPDPIKKNCPVEYQITLERFLIYAAKVDFFRMVGHENMPAAKYLLRNFPSMKSIEWGFIKARIKVIFPWMIPWVRTIKKLIKTG
jgi:glycosyltransferase involved in cell wall biosynthesis